MSEVAAQIVLIFLLLSKIILSIFLYNFSEMSPYYYRYQCSEILILLGDRFPKLGQSS